MVGRVVDVVPVLDLARAGRGTADAAREVDTETAVATLVGTHDEEAVGDGAVEAGPVEGLEGVVELAGDGGHGSRPVCLLLQRGLDGGNHLHVLSHPLVGWSGGRQRLDHGFSCNSGWSSSAREARVMMPRFALSGLGWKESTRPKGRPGSLCNRPLPKGKVERRSPGLRIAA